jgi:hypothetical protein
VEDSEYNGWDGLFELNVLAQDGEFNGCDGLLEFTV